MRWVEDEEGVRIRVERPETREKYRFRKPDMVMIHLFGKTVAFRVP